MGPTPLPRIAFDLREPWGACRVQLAYPAREGVALPNDDVRIALTGYSDRFSAQRGVA